MRGMVGDSLTRARRAGGPQDGDDRVTAGPVEKRGRGTMGPKRLFTAFSAR